MTATLDARNRIPSRLRNLGMTHEFFTTLCGVNKAQFSRMLNGKKSLNDHVIQFDAMLRDLEELVALFRPLPILWRNVDETRELLKGLHESPAMPESKPQPVDETLKSDWLALLESR